MDLFAEVTSLAAALDAAGVEFALCGGVALAIHGAPRATRDIDVMARAADLPRLREVVGACGFTIEGLPMTFSASGVSIRRFTKVVAGAPALMLDVLIADDALEAVWAGRCRVAFARSDGEMSSLPVVSRDGLVTLKLAAGRPQDLVDIQRLQELGRGEP